VPNNSKPRAPPPSSADANDLDEDEDAPEDADVPAEPDDAAGQAVEEALYAAEYDPTFNRARRFGKNEKLTSIKTGMCLVGGRWLSSAPNSSDKEADLGTHMTGLSASFWAPRIESPRDTFQILHVSQVEGKAWGRPFWYKRGAPGFGGCGGLAESLLADEGAGGGVGAGAGAGAGAGEGAGAASTSRPAAVLVSFKFI
jgi:hypothetical protein